MSTLREHFEQLRALSHNRAAPEYRALVALMVVATHLDELIGLKDALDAAHAYIREVERWGVPSGLMPMDFAERHQKAIKAAAADPWDFSDPRPRNDEHQF